MTTLPPGVAGPQRPLPALPAHELVEAQAATRPDDVALIHGHQTWTYAELDRRANRLAHRLLEENLRPEDVVAVVAERTPGWVAALLAVLKAGGVYLPVEPHFPPERIAAMLRRSDCRLALVEGGAGASLDRLAERPRTVPIESAVTPPSDPDRDASPGLRIPADRAAYVFFTSGSTGEPKGAVCQHDGMLNHLLAKIEDLDLGPGDVVAQTAPQCFDISVWQVLAPLLSRGRVLLVPQHVVLDVPSFVDTLAASGVAVTQLVPSYLEVVLSHLERHPRALPDLRMVSVTGEALPVPLARRWFARHPDIPLLNAYGLTETSDDTNHELLTEAPTGRRVAVGRPVRNVRVAVVDAQLAPVPLGEPGEVVFSGVCVGRGYLNDPERTARSFLGDPARPGERLYRSGDRGRWLPDGRLEFLGRLDNQVKVNGFRIELGEVEGVLAAQPGVAQAAVVVAADGDHLVGFHTGPEPVDADRLAAGMQTTLPAYLVPTEHHWLPRLPLTDNGKVDRAALVRGASPAAPDDEPSCHEPGGRGTPEERRLAAAWARVLAVPLDTVRPHHHFFERGGTSLAAVRLVLALDRDISLEAVTSHPVLADLARQLPRPGGDR